MSESSPALHATRAVQEAQEQEQKRLAAEMFNSVGHYLEGKLESTTADYALLEDMNKVASQKYKEMADDAERMTSSMEALQQQCRLCSAIDCTPFAYARV
jgi:Biogenesis of lysosome-related organelles complex-1 subunit 2